MPNYEDLFVSEIFGFSEIPLELEAWEIQPEEEEDDL